MDELTRTAWHEAGHVVVRLLQFRRFRYVTTRPPTPDVAGLVAVPPVRVDPVTQVISAHAGPLAEGLYELTTVTDDELEADGLIPGDVIAGAYLNGGCDDLKLIGSVGINPDGTDVVQGVARKIVTEQWAAVERVAVGLIEHRTLSYATAADLAALPQR